MEPNTEHETGKREERDFKGETRLKFGAALLSVASNLTLTTAKVVIGLVTGSVSVLSEGIHSGLDLTAALIATISVRLSGRPADPAHPFGHGKFENVSGTIEALLIFVAAVWIMIEATERLVHGGRIEQPSLGVVVMGLSVVMNTLVSRYLFKVARKSDSVALAADALHLSTDVYTSLGVLVGLGIMYFTGIHILDPIIAIGVAILIIKAAYELTREAFVPLLDASLPEREQKVIREAIDRYCDQFVEVHKVRTRKAGGERQVDLHLVVPESTPVVAAHMLGDKIVAEIKRCLPNITVLVHVEPGAEDDMKAKAPQPDRRG